MAKINLFEDKVYDGLDWLEMAVEPYICPLNDILSHLPDSISLSLEDLIELELFSDSASASQDNVVKFALKKEGFFLEESKIKMIENFMEIQFPSGDCFVDLENMTMRGEVLLVKKVNILEDEDIKTWLNERVQLILRYRNKPDIPRMSEIQDLLGCRDATKSVKNKYKAISKKMEDVVLKDEWRVRDTQLMESVARWIVDYIDNGNLASLSNFTRLKCMVHKNAPIYSMEETK